MTRHYEAGNPPDIYLEKYQRERPRHAHLEWAVVLIVLAIVGCILFQKAAYGAQDGTLWPDGSLTFSDFTLYSKPHDTASLMILDLPPAPPYYLQVESLAGVSPFGIGMVGGDVGTTVDIGDFDLPVWGYGQLLPAGVHILDVTELVQSLPPQQRTVGFRLSGWGEIWSLDTECGLRPQIVPEPSTLGTLAAFLATLAGTIRRRR